MLFFLGVEFLGESCFLLEGGGGAGAGGGPEHRNLVIQSDQNLASQVWLAGLAWQGGKSCPPR